MLVAMIIVCLLFSLAMGGKTLLMAAAAMPIIGIFATWYAGIVGPLPDGMVSNLIYGGMVAQIFLLPLSVLLYGPGWFRWLRCVLLRGGHRYGRWWWPDRAEAHSLCEECADMRTPKNRHSWLHRERVSDNAINAADS